MAEDLTILEKILLKTIIFDIGGVYFSDDTRIAIETINLLWRILSGG
jgi:hypothetical protein